MSKTSIELFAEHLFHSNIARVRLGADMFVYYGGALQSHYHHGQAKAQHKFFGCRSQTHHKASDSVQEQQYEASGVPGIENQQDRADKRGCKRFLELPAELRNRVYELALIRPKITIISAPEKLLQLPNISHTILPISDAENWDGFSLVLSVLKRSCRDRKPKTELYGYQRKHYADGIYNLLSHLASYGL